MSIVFGQKYQVLHCVEFQAFRTFVVYFVSFSTWRDTPPQRKSSTDVGCFELKRFMPSKQDVWRYAEATTCINI